MRSASESRRAFQTRQCPKNRPPTAASWTSSPPPSASTACNCGPTKCWPKRAGPAARPHRGSQCGARAVGRMGKPRIAARHGSGLDPQRLLPRPLPLPAVPAARRSKPGWRSSSRRCSAGPNCNRGARGHRRPAATPAGAWPKPPNDVAKIHETLRDLVRVFEDLTENAQAFMAGVARSIELQQAEPAAVALQAPPDRLPGALHGRPGAPVRRHRPPHPGTGAAHRRPAAPGPANARRATPRPGTQNPGRTRKCSAWQALARTLERPARLVLSPPGTSRRKPICFARRARSAIPQLLGAIAALNERRSGRSDRSADFRVLAGWFAGCAAMPTRIASPERPSR